MKRLIAMGLLVLALPVIGQDPEGRYFALSSNRTFAPGEKPQIQMWAQGVKALDFRLYRVNEASEFLSQLRDAHSFGNETAALPREDTPLLRFARFKRRWREKAQLLVRQQFTAAARAEWRGRPAPAATAASATKGTGFAAIPLLNDKQLVRTWRETVRGKERWDEQVVDIPAREAGLYLVEATDGKLRAYTIMSVSAMAVLTKTQPGLVMTRVVDRASGRGMPGVEVEFRSQARLNTVVRTDAQGFARLESKDTADAFVIARRNGDVAFDAVSGYALNPQSGRHTQFYAYTDRPVYRPGHKVFFKATLRDRLPSGYEIPNSGPVRVEILDQEGKPVFQRDLAMSRFGSLSGEYELPVTVPLGQYMIQFSREAAQGYTSFQVEEYRKPEYEVKIKPAAPRVLQGEKVSALISARYYFGEPLRNAKVVYTVRRSPYYPPWQESEEGDFEQTEGDESGGEFFRGEQGEEQTGLLNEQGELPITIPAPLVNRDYLFRIEARVMDEGNREVTGYGMVLATRGNYQVRVRSQRYVLAPGEDGVFEIELIDYENRPVAAGWRADLLRFDYSRNGTRMEGIESVSGTTGTGGTGRAVFRLARAGSYRVRVSSRTPAGREVSEEEHVWVSGSGISFGGETVRLIADKKTYAAGETAKILILAAEPDTDIWLSLEGRTIVESRAVQARGAGGVTVEVPVRGDYSPGIFVTATFLKQGKLSQGSLKLRVPPVEKALGVEVVTAKAEFKPGEPVEYQVRVKDHRGQPVEAELSLGIVDEALYAVRRDATLTPMSFFYGSFYNEVSTSSSLSYYFRGEAGQRAMRLAKLRPSLGQLKPEQVGDPRVRKAFPDTAFWRADVVTDRRGEARVSLDFPDSLTQWRATARAITANTLVGAALHRLTVRKNLLLRSALPRFLREGDEVSLGFVVQNYLTGAKQVKVNLAATGVELLESAEKTITLAAKASARVEFRAHVRPGQKSVLTASAITDEESDALEMTVPVEPFGTLLSFGASGVVADSGSAGTEIEAPEESGRELELRLAPTLAGSLLASLDYLTQYPYGCTEQTLSSFLPTLMVSQTLDSLRLKTSLDREDLAKKLKAGLDRLYDFQHEDGAWGWWKNDTSHPFMTAHVLAGLKQAQAAGQVVSSEVLGRAETWLRGEFNRQSEARVDLRAYLAYSLGTKADLEKVWPQRGRMSAYGLAFLGLGLDALGDARAKAVAQTLEGQARQEGPEAWWSGEYDPLLDYAADTSPETTAHVAKLLSRTRPDSPLLPKAVVWLLRHKDQGSHWSSTKQTAMVIYGVIDYLKHSGELNPDLSVTVEHNNNVILERRIGAAEVRGGSDIVLKVPAAARNAIRIRTTGKGRLYWGAQVRYYSQAENVRPSLPLERTYYRLVPTYNGRETTYSLVPLSGEIRPGDLIAARLRVSARDERYVLIEDPIPAGMELVTKDGDYNLTGKPFWWSYHWEQREYRDNRVAFFRTRMNEKTEEFFYLMKAVHPGRFRVPPPRLVPMYQPAATATGKAERIEVLP
ncbi:MAG: alpha-2-macroglobulin family protein [Acidobacteriota bacterium]|jgi:uncharacterized protein YfaS (alpha-2-macroglobulin family)